MYQSSVNKTEMEQEKKHFFSRRFGAPDPAWQMSLVVITHNIKAGNLKSPCNAVILMTDKKNVLTVTQCVYVLAFENLCRASPKIIMEILQCCS